MSESWKTALEMEGGFQNLIFGFVAHFAHLKYISLSEWEVKL